MNVCAHKWSLFFLGKNRPALQTRKNFTNSLVWLKYADFLILGKVHALRSLEISWWCPITHLLLPDN